MKKDLIYPGTTDFDLILQGLEGNPSSAFRELFPSGNRAILFSDPMSGRIMIGDEETFREYENEEVGCFDEGINPDYQDWFYDQNDGVPIEDFLTPMESQIVDQIMSA